MDLPFQTETTGKHKSLYRYLVILIFTTLLPVLLAGTVAIWLVAKDFRNDSEQRLQDTVAVLAHVIEEEIEKHYTLLHFISAAIPSADSSSETIRLLLQIAGLAEHSTVMIAALNDTTFPYEVQQLIKEVINNNKPALSNLIASDNTRDMLAIAVPHSQAEQPSALVLLAIASELFKLNTNSTSEYSGLLTAITDANGYIVARSREIDRYAGKPVPDWDKLQQQGSQLGVFEAKTKEGTAVIFAFNILGNTPGWAIVAGEPLAQFTAHWRRPLFGIAVGCIIAALLALIAVSRLSRRILQPIQALAAYSTKVATGASVATSHAIPSSTVTEFEVLRSSLVKAEAVLNKRAEDARQMADNISRSKKRYQAVAKAGALVFWRCDLTGSLLRVTGWEELTGQTEQNILGQSWTTKVHTEDRHHVEKYWLERRKKGDQLDTECRIKKKNGEWHWVRARGVLLVNDDEQEWVGVLEDIQARKLAEAKILYMARHDNLTGLANRTAFHEALQDALLQAQNGTFSSLLTLDLDKFKDVNDTFGHPAGDSLLLAVTERLKHNCRNTDIIARQGGDEFAILQLGKTDNIEKLAQRLIDVVKAPYIINDHTVTIGVSIGIAIITRQSLSTEQILQAADMALYQAKNSGRGCFCIHMSEYAAG